MQFKHPELLYALFLLVIPIIIHLFQLRKFKTIAFTNIAILKEATIQTRKSSQIKKWLILSTRLLLFASIILAFAQPFFSNINTRNTSKETVIYLDNSFSMQAKGSQGELLKRAVQDIISNLPEDDNITLLTNDNIYKNTTIKAIKNELLELDYSSNKLSLQAAFLKSNSFFSKQNNTLKDLIFISDFQNDNSDFRLTNDSLKSIYLVDLKPLNTYNISIDSVYISNKTASNIEITVSIKNSGPFIENLPISLFNSDNLIAKTSVAIDKEITTTFSLPSNEIFKGKITISDTQLQFDNSLFFNINNTSKINILTINANDDSFLKRIFTDSEFNYISVSENQLDFSILEQQHLIVLNELEAISRSLITALKAFTEQGGHLLVIPSSTIIKQDYTALLYDYGINLNTYITTEKSITTINYSHPLYNKGVFEKQIRNFQYPKVNSFYGVKANNASAVLKFEDGVPFLFESNNIYVFASALNDENSNFKNSPLIVPTLYNIGKFSFKIPDLYYTIGKENSFDINTKLLQDDILYLVANNINIIPMQQNYNSKVVINTAETPSISGIYDVKNKTESLKNVSYNYDRSESNLSYQNLSSLNDITLSDSVTDIFDTIKSDTKINTLWKWFVIFALVLLIIEMLILKYFK